MVGKVIGIAIGLAVVGGISTAVAHTEDGLTANAKVGSVKATDGGVKVSGKLKVSAPGGDPDMYGAICKLAVSVKRAGSRRISVYVNVTANQTRAARWTTTIKDPDGNASSKGTAEVVHCHQDIIQF